MGIILGIFVAAVEIGLTAFGQGVGDGDNSGWKSTTGLVEGTDAGAMACLVRGMAGLDPRRIRLDYFSAADAAHIADLQRTLGRCNGGAGADAVDAMDCRREIEQSDGG